MPCKNLGFIIFVFCDFTEPEKRLSLMSIYHSSIALLTEGFFVSKKSLMRHIPAFEEIFSNAKERTGYLEATSPFTYGYQQQETGRSIWAQEEAGLSDTGASMNTTVSQENSKADLRT